MFKHLLFIVLISFALLNFNCKKTLTGPDSPFTLTVEDVSCTEAWVKITSANFQNPSSLTLFVNDKPNQTLTLVSSDTLLYVDSLLPNQSYKINAAFAANNQQQTTNEVIAKTMDTTNHTFTWQTFTFGENSNSVLYDVAIIDENNIWAVGEIYMKDSLGKPDYNAYNAVHWDGNNWELKRIPISLNGTPFYPVIKSVFAFNNNDVWFEAGIHWNGNSFSNVPFNINFPSNVNKLWGTSSNDLYAVGNSGNIAHYNGTSWKKIESGTITNINDIYGTVDKNGKQRIFCAVTNVHADGDIKLLKIDENKKAEDIPITVIGERGYTISSVWTDKRKTYFCGDGVFASSDDLLFKEVKVNDRYKYKIRGNGVNDVYMVDYGAVSHYNGSTWSEIYLWGLSYLRSGTVKGQIAAACGEQGSKAVIIMLNH